MSLWVWFVGQVWPNLVASILWSTPAFAAHHVLIRRHITAEAERTRGDR